MTTMDYREEQFKRKFTDAARQFGVSPDQVVSVKLRDSVGSHTEYQQLLHAIEHEAGLHCTSINGDLQGSGHLLEDGKNKIIFVEHESGLEILYIAGSVASLIGLIPVVLQCWRGIRGHPGRHQADDQPIEIRRLGRDGRLHEDRSSRAYSFLATPVGFSTALTTVATLMENEMRVLVGELRRLEARVDKLDGRLKVRAKSKKPSTRATAS
jgi:hypothetical protein